MLQFEQKLLCKRPFLDDYSLKKSSMLLIPCSCSRPTATAVAAAAEVQQRKCLNWWIKTAEWPVAAYRNRVGLPQCVLRSTYTMHCAAVFIILCSQHYWISWFWFWTVFGSMLIGLIIVSPAKTTTIYKYISGLSCSRRPQSCQSININQSMFSFQETWLIESEQEQKLCNY